MSLLRETSHGPDGKTPANTVAAFGRDGNTGATFTNFNTDGYGVAMGVRDMRTGQTIVAIFSPEDTEELRQQLNTWYGPRATLSEVKHG